MQKLRLFWRCLCNQLSNVDPAKIYVLVLDRNPKSAHFIGEILHSSGYRVSITTHQSEAVALAKEKLFNLVVKAFDPDTVDAIALMNTNLSATDSAP